jgi:hypothetical protein
MFYICLPLAPFREHTAYVQVPYQRALQVGLSSQQVAAETLVSNLGHEGKRSSELPLSQHLANKYIVKFASRDQATSGTKPPDFHLTVFSKYIKPPAPWAGFQSNSAPLPPSSRPDQKIMATPPVSGPPQPQSEKLVPQIPANVYGGNRPSKTLC